MSKSSSPRLTTLRKRTVTLRVGASTWAIARRLARGRGDGRIETLLEKWLNDLAEGETRPGCAEAGWTGAWLTTLPSRSEEDDLWR